MSLENNKLFASTYKALDWAFENLCVKCVFDLGANTGGWVGYWLKKEEMEEYHLFEPVPDLAPALQALAQEDPRIVFNQVAVGDKPSRVKDVSVYNTWTLLSTSQVKGVARAREYRSQPTFEMGVVTLDDYIKETGARPDFIKVDVDGYELRVLKGAKAFLSEFPVPMYFEYSYLPKLLGDSVEEMCRLIYELGYRAVCMDRGYFSPDWKDMLKYLPYNTSFDIMLIHESQLNLIIHNS